MAARPRGLTPPCRPRKTKLSTGVQGVVLSGAAKGGERLAASPGGQPDWVGPLDAQRSFRDS